MNDEQVKDALRGLGSSGDLANLRVGPIVAAGRARRRRRVAGAAGALLVALAAPYAVYTATHDTLGNAPVAGPGATSIGLSTRSNIPTSSGPLSAPMAPACPPAPPQLVQNASKDAAPLSQPLRVTAGHSVQFYAAQRHPNASDRPILSVQLIVARPLTEWTAERELNGVKLHGSADLEKSENQIAPSQVVSSPGAIKAMTVSVPSTTAPGRYPVFMIATFPGPSLCGHLNEDAQTPRGESWGQVATLIVTGSTR